MMERLSLFGPTLPPPDPRRRRRNPHILFYAILPPPGPAAQIARLREGLRATPGRNDGEVAMDQLHITTYAICGGHEPPPTWLVKVACDAAVSIASTPLTP